MVMKDRAKEASNDILNSIKEKVKDSAKQFAKEKIKKELVLTLRGYEQKIERKVKYELKRFGYIFSGLFLLGIGVLFVLYSIFGYVSFLNELPQFATDFFFGVFLLLLGLVFYFIYK